MQPPSSSDGKGACESNLITPVICMQIIALVKRVSPFTRFSSLSLPLLSFISLFAAHYGFSRSGNVCPEKATDCFTPLSPLLCRRTEESRVMAGAACQLQSLGRKMVRPSLANLSILSESRADARAAATFLLFIGKRQEEVMVSERRRS